MEEYKYDEESVNALVKWAETATFPEQVMLSDAENIFDVKRYVRANLRLPIFHGKLRKRRITVLISAYSTTASICR